jgi:hypothetical protein
VVKENTLKNNDMKPMYKKGGNKKNAMKKDSYMLENIELDFEKESMGMGGRMKYKKGGAVPECGPGKFWDGSKCVDSKTNKLPETSWPDDLVNELIPTYDKKTGKREYSYSEGIFDAEGRARTVDYDEVKKQKKEREREKKKTGGKSMEPGGGGRFAAMVSGLKKEGKSEGSAKAIAASIGRKKYGKSRFQEMAAAGKKKMGGKK